MDLNSSAVHPKDDNLLKIALQGDQEALDVLFTRYRRLLYDLARRILRNHEEAEDAVQNCLLLGYRNLSNVNCEGSFRSWLVESLSTRPSLLSARKKADPQQSRHRHLRKQTGLKAFLLEDLIQNKRLRNENPSVLSWRTWSACPLHCGWR